MHLLRKSPTERPENATIVAKELSRIQGSLLAVPLAEEISDNPWSELDHPDSGATEIMPSVHLTEPKIKTKPNSRPNSDRKKLFRAGVLSLLGLMLLIIGTVAVIVIIRDEDGKKVAEIEGPSGGKVEILPGGASGTKLQPPVVPLLPKITPAEPILPVISKYLSEPGPFDKLDGNKISDELKFEGIPKEVVGAFGIRNRLSSLDPHLRHVQLSNDGKWLAMKSSDGGCIWDMATLTPHYVTNNSWADSQCVFSNDSKKVAFGDKWVRIYDLTGKTPRLEQLNKSMRSPVAFFPDSKRVVSPFQYPDRKSLVIWSTDPAIKEIQEINFPSEIAWVSGLIVSGNGKRIVARAFYEDPAKANIFVWDIEQQPAKLLHTIPTQRGSSPRTYTPFLITDDGSTLTEGVYHPEVDEQYHRIAVWDISKPTPIMKYREMIPLKGRRDIVCLVQWYDQNNSEILIGSGGFGNTYSIWSIKDGFKKVREIPLWVQAIGAENTRMIQLQYSNRRIDILDQQGKLLSSGADPRFDRYRLPCIIGDLIYTTSGNLEELHKTVHHLDQLIDGEFRYVGEVAGLNYHGHYSKRSPTGDFLASMPFSKWYDGKMKLAQSGIQLWPVVDGRLLPRKDELTFERAGGYVDWTWQPDGKAIWTAMTNGEIHKWDITQRPPVLQTIGTHDQVKQLTWSADAKTLVTAGGSEVKLWDMKFARPIARSVPISAGIQAIDSAFLDLSKNALWISGSNKDFGLVYRQSLDRFDVGPEVVFPDAGTRMKVSPNGRIVASWHTDNGWTFWDCQTRKVITKWDVGPYEYESGFWLEDGRHFCVVQYGAVYFLRLETTPAKPASASMVPKS
ncbi:MAG: WD40 repeat domain-containing protein [Zavarzinella sp.]